MAHNPLADRVAEWLREHAEFANLDIEGFACADTLEIATGLGEDPVAVRRACQTLRRRGILIIRGRVGYGDIRHESDHKRVGWEQWQINWTQENVPARVRGSDNDPQR